MWIIEDITEFVQNVQPVQQNKVDKFLLQTYFGGFYMGVFLKQTRRNSNFNSCQVYGLSIFEHQNESHKAVQTRYISVSDRNVEREIARISTSDIEEFSSMGATGDIILEMYVTLVL